MFLQTLVVSGFSADSGDGRLSPPSFFFLFLVTGYWPTSDLGESTSNSVYVEFFLRNVRAVLSLHDLAAVTWDSTWNINVVMTLCLSLLSLPTTNCYLCCVAKIQCAEWQWCFRLIVLHPFSQSIFLAITWRSIWHKQPSGSACSCHKSNIDAMIPEGAVPAWQVSVCLYSQVLLIYPGTDSVRPSVFLQPMRSSP